MSNSFFLSPNLNKQVMCFVKVPSVTNRITKTVDDVKDSLPANFLLSHLYEFIGRGISPSKIEGFQGSKIL